MNRPVGQSGRSSSTKEQEVAAIPDSNRTVSARIFESFNRMIDSFQFSVFSFRRVDSHRIRRGAEDCRGCGGDALEGNPLRTSIDNYNNFQTSVSLETYTLSSLCPRKDVDLNTKISLFLLIVIRKIDIDVRNCRRA